MKPSDARLNRPEYITGIKSPVVISEVLNSTGETGGLPQGNMAGHGVSVNVGGGKEYYAREHGYVIGIMSVCPKTAFALQRFLEKQPRIVTGKHHGRPYYLAEGHQFDQ